MYRVRNIIFILFLYLGLCNPIKAHVALDYPQGGETFIEGQTIHIAWHIVVPHQTLNYDLLFSSNGGADWEPIMMNISADSLSFTWVVPSTFTSQGRVRVIQDNTGTDYYGTSTDFSIVPNTSPPSMDGPANDTIIHCNLAGQGMALQAWLDNHGGAYATNHCSELIWTHDFNGLSNGCGATGSALVIFTATDDCGSTFTIANVSVVDNQPPVFNGSPVNLNVECDGMGNSVDLNHWLINHGGAQASDACGNIVWTHNITTLTDACGASGSSVVTFFATDECGNSSSATASFIIMDSTSPVITATARDTIIECAPIEGLVIQQWLDNHGGAQANDVCGNVSWTHNFSGLTPTCGGAGYASVTFTAIDECGNKSTTIATLTVQDSLAPVIHVSAHDTVIVCGTPELPTLIQSWLDNQGGAVASDGCGNVGWTNDYAFGSDSCIVDSVLITFTATDECGNGVTTQASLTLKDTTIVIADTTVFAPIGTTWYYSGSSLGPPWLTDPLYCYFLVEKDTIILGRDARVIGCYKNNEDEVERVDSLTMYISVSGAQVHYKVGDEFVLLYDFGAEPGDTIHSKVESSDLSLGCLSSFEEDIIDFSYIINSVGTMIIDGEELRVQYVTSIYEPGEDNWGFLFGESVIERIGYNGPGGFWWGQGLGCILETGYLRCYEDADISWRNPEFNNSLACDYVSTYDIDEIEFIPLHPNPTSGLVHLPEGASSISIFSVEGQKVDFDQNQNEIDLSGNPSGLYIVTFGMGEHRYFSKVFIW